MMTALRHETGFKAAIGKKTARTSLCVKYILCKPDVVRRHAATRVMILSAVMLCAFTIAIVRMAYVGFVWDYESHTALKDTKIASVRPDILDRNGELLATDIRVSSLYAEPRIIIDADEAAEKIVEVLPEINVRDLREKLESKKGFVWVKREISKKDRDAIHALGLPGVGFQTEHKRIYPKGNLAAHVLGTVNIDNQGISGIEYTLDKLGLAEIRKAGLLKESELRPVHLALDARVQHVLEDELHRALKEYEAKAAAAAMIDINTGEIIAMASLPDFNPNKPQQALKDNALNRILTGTYELGSIFKSFTTATALDSNTYSLASKFDTREPLRIGKHTINDFHGTKTWLTMSEVFLHSSNIGTAKMALGFGAETQKEYFKRFRLLDKVETELPEAASPITPPSWGPITVATTSYGHGITVTPMQALAAVAPLMNGGIWYQPTIIKKNKGLEEGVRILKPHTSEVLRVLFRKNVIVGTGKRANVNGYSVGGKTGTSEKVINGRYDKNKKLNSFLSAFPTNDPKYGLIVMVDEPKKVDARTGLGTAGVNASPTSGRIIARAAPLLGIIPTDEVTPSGLDPALITAHKW